MGANLGAAGNIFDGAVAVGVSHLLEKYHARIPVSGEPCLGRRRVQPGTPQDRIFASRVPLGAQGFLSASILLLAALWPVGLRAQVQGAYRIDTHASHVEIHLFRGGFLSMLGSDHLIALTHFSGTAQLSDDQPWWVLMLGEATSLTVLDPWASPSDRREVAETMLGPTQLDVKHYPSIKLQSSSIRPGQQADDWRLLADVTLHGVTRQVEFPLDCQQDGDRLRVRGKTDLHLRDFNIQPLSVALGAFKVKDVFEVKYDITLQRKP